MPVPTEIPGVRALTKANVYFDGGVVSHTLLAANGTKTTLGLIRPGAYHFATGKAERMDIVAGSCSVTLDGATASTAYAAGATFEIPANAGFTIRVETGLCEYVCTFLD